ncbi:MAG: glycosyltransferase family 4 protein [Flavobacteriales bacterium]|nr:glycosyltransferase family 4 protein [Flavobacteriales bacterium]MCB9447573.1 glycosyltransferase family 4 protein [Flavobacteriales bacterium]
MPRLVIVVSHPIQYYAPLFRYLSRSLDLVVLYCAQPDSALQGKDGFGIAFRWDVDLLDGYAHEFLENKATHPSLSSFSGCDTPQIGAAIQRLQATHVLIFGWYLKSYWQAYFHCLRHRIPMGVRGDSQENPHENKQKKFLKRILYPLFVRRYHTIFYVGKRNLAYMRMMGARNRQLVYSPHAIDQEFWKLQEEPKDKTGRRPVFLWVAKFIDKKRPHDVIDAFRMFTGNHADAELWMVGTGPLLESCRDACRDLPGVKFLGFKNQTELRAIYPRAHAIVLSSDYGETWGLVVNEAMSMGIPAIVSDACGCAEDMVDDGRTGFVYPLGNVHALSDRMQQLFEQYKTPRWSEEGIRERCRIHSFQTIAKGIQAFVGEEGTA